MTDADAFKIWLHGRSIVKNFGGERAAWEGWQAAKEDERRKAEAKQKQEVEHE